MATINIIFSAQNGCWKGSGKSQPSGNRGISCRWDKMVKLRVWFPNTLKEQS